MLPDLPDRAKTAEAVVEALEDPRDLVPGFIPDQGAVDGGTSFVLGSCQYPGTLIDRVAAYDSYRRLRSAIESEGGPRFLILTGDQVYVDATAGLYDPTQDDDRYEQPYKFWLGKHHVRHSLRQVRSYMLLDDHEIENDWEPPDDQPPNPDSAIVQGIEGYVKYQRPRNLVPPRLHYGFTRDHCHFFMLTTRTDRSDRADVQPDSLLRVDQINALTAFLARDTVDEPKFVVSPSILLPRHRKSFAWNEPTSVFRSDSWDGYPGTLFNMLAFIVEFGIGKIVFLSGDEHIACFAEVEVYRDGDRANGKTISSYHTAPAYAPFPFANSIEEDFVFDYDNVEENDPDDETDDVYPDSFSFQVNGNLYHCNLNFIFPHRGNGFTLITVAGSTVTPSII